MFDWILDLFKKVWKFIKKALNKIMEVLKDVLPYLLIAGAVFLATLSGTAILGLPIFLQGLATFLVGVGPLAAAAIGAGVSFLLAPEETAGLLTNVAEAVGEVASAAVQMAGDVVSTGFASIFGENFLIYAALGLGAYLLLTKEENKSVVEVKNV